MVKVSRNLKTIYYRADRYRHEVEKTEGLSREWRRYVRL